MEAKRLMSIILRIWANLYVIVLKVLKKQNTRRVYQTSRPPTVNSGTLRYIQTYPDIIRHIQTYSRVIHGYSKHSVTLAYSELWYIQNPSIRKTRAIFRTLAYPKLWHIQNQRHIQNPGLFRTLRYSESEINSEACQTSAMERFEKQPKAIIIFAVSAFHVL